MNEPVVQTKEVENRVDVPIPGKQIFRERFVQPIQTIEQEVLNLKRGVSETKELPDVILPPEYNEKIIEKNYEAPVREVYYQPVIERKVVN